MYYNNRSTKGKVVNVKRTKINDRKLPDYTRGEEIMNMVTHIVGGAFGIVALVLCIVYAVRNGNTWGIVGGSIFGAMMILLYTMSSIYHGLTAERAKKVFQVFDHCTIYFLIAGTYAPLMLTGVRSYSKVLCGVFYGTVLALSVLGITLTAIDLRKFRAVSMVFYFGIGWSLVFAFGLLLKIYPPQFIGWLIGGGVAYTLGIIFYGIGTKRRYAHSVFHLFVIAGSVLHFVGILLYCM